MKPDGFFSKLRGGKERCGRVWGRADTWAWSELFPRIQTSHCDTPAGRTSVITWWTDPHSAQTCACFSLQYIGTSSITFLNYYIDSHAQDTVWLMILTGCWDHSVCFFSGLRNTVKVINYSRNRQCFCGAAGDEHEKHQRNRWNRQQFAIKYQTWPTFVQLWQPSTRGRD